MTKDWEDEQISEEDKKIKIEFPSEEKKNTGDAERKNDFFSGPRE